MNRFNPDIHHRRSIRLKGYDYSQAGAYFVTICVHDRECLFGEIVDGEMRMRQFGHIVAAEWIRTAELRPEIELGEYVVMPNHFHGIVLITDTSYNGECCGDGAHCRGTARRAPTEEQFGKPVAGSLPTIIRSFKAAVTKRINEFRESPGLPVWQRNYHEHIIRNEADYNRIAEYVIANPQRWIEDKLHPDNIVVYGGTVGGNTNIGGNADIGGNGNIGGNGTIRGDAGIVGARCAVPLRTCPTGRPQ